MHGSLIFSPEAVRSGLKRSAAARHLFSLSRKIDNQPKQSKKISLKQSSGDACVGRKSSNSSGGPPGSKDSKSFLQIRPTKKQNLASALLKSSCRIKSWRDYSSSMVFSCWKSVRLSKLLRQSFGISSGRENTVRPRSCSCGVLPQRA